MDCWNSGAWGVTTDTMRLACDHACDSVLPLQFFSSGLRRCQIWPFMAKYNFQNSQKFSQNFLHKKWKSLIIADFLYSKQVFSLKLLYIIFKFALVNYTRTILKKIDYDQSHRIQSVRH